MYKTAFFPSPYLRFDLFGAI